MKKQTKMIFAIILILMIALFAVLNIQSVSVNFGFGKLELPMIIMLILWILIGAAISFLLSTSNVLNNHREKKAADKKISDLQSKINTLNVKVDHDQSIEDKKQSNND